MSKNTNNNRRHEGANATAFDIASTLAHYHGDRAWSIALRISNSDRIKRGRREDLRRWQAVELLLDSTRYDEW